MNRVYHPYTEWEEIRANMWGDVPDKKAALSSAIAFTGDHELYGHYMLRVVAEWPKSCENALTDGALNQKAWVGHAAVAMALQIPEDITREAWGHLTDEQRTLANRQADRAIRIWRDNYSKNRDLRDDMAQEMLSGWDTGRSAKKTCSIRKGTKLESNCNMSFEK